MDTTLAQQIEAMLSGQTADVPGDDLVRLSGQYAELFKRLETDSFNFHSNNFDDFLSVVDLGTKLCKLNLFKQDRFWYTLQNIKFSRNHHIKKGASNTCIRRSLELDSQWPSWKLLIVLNNLQRDSPSVKQELKQSINEYLVDYSSFTSFLAKISNFQQLFHFLRLISTLDKVKSDSPTHSVIGSFLADEGKGISVAKFKPSAIMKFIFDSEYLSFQNMWKVNSIKFKNKKNGIFSPIDPITMHGAATFFLIQFIYDKLYILGANCSVLELNRNDIKVVKDLKSVIKLCIVPANVAEYHTGIPAQNILLSAELDFGQGNSCDQFFYEFTNVPKISIPKKYIALNYSDTANENEEEEELDEGKDMHKETPDISLPEVHGESSSDFGEHLVALRVETDGIFRTQIPATPQNSDPKGVVKMNEFRPPPIEDSPLALREKRRGARETAIAQSTKEEQHTTNNDTYTDSGGVSNSLVITKINEKAGNKEKHLAETFNQPQVGTELTKLIKLPERRDISLLNSIFDTKNTHSVRKKKKMKTTWRKKKAEKIVRQQQELKNVHPVVIVPTQTTSQLKQGQEKVQKANPTVTQQQQSDVRVEASLLGENHSNFNAGAIDLKCPAFLDGPALRTRKKSSSSSTKVQAVSELHPEPCISKKQKEVTPMRVEGPLEMKDIRAEETASVTCIDANTSILNGAFKGDQLHRQGSSMFIGDLQQQITHSILSFTESLSKKMELINQELGERILTDLSSKYRTLFAELQQNFQNDTEEMLSFIDQIKHMLKLPEPELLRLLKLRGKRS